TGTAEIDLDHPLQDFEDCAGADFAHWVDAARQRILSAARADLLRAFREGRSRGEAKFVHRLAGRLYRVDPFNELAAQTLAERMLLEGDTGGAGRLLHDFITRAEQVGPGIRQTNIRRLVERLESGAHPPTDILPGHLKTKTDDTPDLFVGREGELGALESMWERVKGGSLCTCLMLGVAGIGKTSLIRQFATSIAARGNLVLVIRCEEIGKAVPFAALADLIDELAKDPALGGTDPHWLAEASRIAPALKAKYSGLPTPDPAPGESVRLRVAEALYRMLETVAEGSPLLIAIDDIQHLDPASRDVLHIVARRFTEEAAMILGAERIEGFDTNTLSGRPATEFGTWDSRLELPALSLTESRDLVVRLTQALENESRCEQIRERIARLADGNPYFLEMLISDWRVHRDASLAASETNGDLTGTKWRPPDTLRLTFSRHYEGLRPKGRQVFELLAVAGRAMNADELGPLLGITADKASRLVLEIIERGVLRLEGDAVSFKNELHRAFVYYAMADESRRYHHGRLARVLIDGADSNVANYLEASHHFVHAGMVDDAMSAAIRGAEDAVSHGAAREAERALRGVVKIVETPSNEVLLLLAESLNQQGQYLEAIKWLRMRSLVGGSIATEAKRTALHAEAMVRGRLGDTEAIAAAVHHGLTAARATQGSLQVVRALQAAAELAGDLGDFNSLSSAEEEARLIASSGSEPATVASGHLTTGFCLWVRGHFAEAYKHLCRSATIFEKLDHPSLVRALNGRGMCAAAFGEFGIAIDSYDRALHLAERNGDYPTACNVAANQANTLANLGMLEEAEGLLQKAWRLNQKTPSNRYSYKVFLNRGMLRLNMHDFGDAEAFVGAAEAAARSSGLKEPLAGVLFAKADVCLAKHLPEEALSFIAEGERILDEASLGASATYIDNVARLREYRAWCGGLDPIKRSDLDEYPRLILASFIELRSFREWATQQTGGVVTERPNARDLVTATGLVGLQLSLEAVGMFPDATTLEEHVSAGE
ncbi:MAG: AAA family ATPase, partial [Planctomycetota bacterium]|nr:AAA family ATPase [Planctomycetota bacterium]